MSSFVLLRFTTGSGGVSTSPSSDFGPLTDLDEVLSLNNNLLPFSVFTVCMYTALTLCSGSLGSVFFYYHFSFEGTPGGLYFDVVLL